MKIYLQSLTAISTLLYGYTQSPGLACISIASLTTLGLMAYLDHKACVKDDALDSRIKLIEDKISGLLMKGNF